MRFLKSFLPNAAIVLNIALLIVVYLDMRNPMMGFLIGTPFLTLVGLCAVTSVGSAVLLYAQNCKQASVKEKTKPEERKLSNKT